MPNPNNGSIFISYSLNDKQACVLLQSALEKAGFVVFRDEASIRKGQGWVSALENALKQCAAFVVLIGRDGVRRWVGAEVHYALIRHHSPHDDAQRLPIFPILLEDIKPDVLPPFLSLFQADRWSAADPLPDALISDIQNALFAMTLMSGSRVARSSVCARLRKKMPCSFLDAVKTRCKRLPVWGISSQAILSNCV